MTQKLLTKEELARHISVKPATVAKWGLTGKIPRIVISRKVIRYDIEKVIEVLRGAADGSR